VNVTAEEIFRRRLLDEDGGVCYFRPPGIGPIRYGACVGPVEAHHLIPRRRLRRIAADLGVPLPVLIADYRNGVLACRRHHRRLPGETGAPRRIELKILELPYRFREFLSQFELWHEAERIYVRPPGHSRGREHASTTPGYGTARDA
jgi:hypothetical protein